MNFAPAATATASAALCVVSQDVDTERKLWRGGAYRAREPRHHRDGRGVDSVFEKGHVAEILDDCRVEADLLQQTRFRDQACLDVVEGSVATWRSSRSRKCLQMQHSDERFFHVEEDTPILVEQFTRNRTTPCQP